MKNKKDITLEDIAAIVTICCTPLTILNQGVSSTLVLFLVLFFVITALFYRNRKLRQQIKFLENIRKLGYPPATMQYLETQKKRKDYNKYYIKNAYVQYKLMTIKKNDTVHQCIEYRFEGSNVGKEPITSHIMNVSKSVFSDFDQIHLGAVDNLSKRQLRVERREKKGNLQLIEVLFPEEGVLRGENFDFSIILDLQEPQSVDTYCYFIIDPENYSKEVEKVYFTLETDERRFEQAEKRLIEVDKATGESKIIANLTTTHDDKNHIYLKKLIKHQARCVYLFNLKMDAGS